MAIGELIRRYERRRCFWHRVRVGPPQECWPWLGRTDRDGSAVFGGRRADEHAYRLARGPLPIGTSVVHRCGHAWCVNPHHLDLGNGAA